MFHHEASLNALTGDATRDVADPACEPNATLAGAVATKAAKHSAGVIAAVTSQAFRGPWWSRLLRRGWLVRGWVKEDACIQNRSKGDDITQSS